MPIREPMQVLMELKASDGNDGLLGAILPAADPRRRQFDQARVAEILPGTNRNARPRDFIVISWDSAMKPTELADYSVGTVWHVRR